MAARNSAKIDWPYVAILACAAVVLLVNLGWPNLFLFDESLYCGTTADMAAHQQWLYPTDEGAFFWIYGKPPAINWLQGLTTKIFGWSIFSLRLPTAMGMLALIGLTSWTARELLGRHTGLVTAGLMLLSARLVHTGRHILLENLVAPFFALSLLMYALSVRRSEAPSRKEWWLGWALAVGSGLAMAAAILTKQAFGLFAPVGVTIAAFVVRPNGWFSRLVVSGVACVVGSFWWFVLTYRAIGQPFLDSVLGYHVQSRFTAVLENHPRGLNAYALSLDNHLVVLPWVVAALGWVAIYPKLTRDWHRVLFASWSALALVQFLVVGQIIKTFLPWYQVVVMPVLFIGAANVLVTWVGLAGVPAWLRWLLPLATVVAAAFSARLDTVWIFLAVMALAYLGNWIVRFKPNLVAPMNRWACGLSGNKRQLALVAGVGLIGIIVANPGHGRDGRYRIDEMLADPSIDKTKVRVLGNEWTRVWMCYAPQVGRVAWSGTCDSLAEQAGGASHVILDGDAANCPPTALGESAQELWRGKTAQGPIALFAFEKSTTAK